MRQLSVTQTVQLTTLCPSLLSSCTGFDFAELWFCVRVYVCVGACMRACVHMCLSSPVEVRPASSLVTARLSVLPSSLREGQEVSLTCSIDAQNQEQRFFSVAWLRGDVELARIGPTGILSVGPEHSEREKDRDFRAARVATGDYRLTLQPVRTEDQGPYACRVWPHERGQDGAFEQGEAQDSDSVLVTISVMGQQTLPAFPPSRFQFFFVLISD